jgi:mRNA interferase YafQ
MPKSIKQTRQFSKDLKKISKSGRYAFEDFEKVLALLVSGDPLPYQYKDHMLVGNWKNHRECHIKPDWLLIYKIDDESITLVRMGSHNQLFF